MIKPIVGLSNPGAEYVATQHNVGFWPVDQLTRMGSVTLCNEMRFRGYVARANLWSNEVWLLQPQTFVNRSGSATAVLACFYKAMPDEILVMYDELDLSPSIVKLKLDGKSGGRNGLKDIATHLTTQQFWQSRLGTGYPRSLSPPGMTVSGQHGVTNFVFKAPRKEEQDPADHAIDQNPGAPPELIAGNAEKAVMRLYTAY